MSTDSQSQLDSTTVETKAILQFASGLLAVVVLGCIIVGISSVMWNLKGYSETSDLGPKQLHFAAATLTGLGLLFALAMAMNVWGGRNGRQVFDACKTAIPPIATLILGYYFGKEYQAQAPPEKPPVRTDPAKTGGGLGQHLRFPAQSAEATMPNLALQRAAAAASGFSRGQGSPGGRVR